MQAESEVVPIPTERRSWRPLPHVRPGRARPPLQGALLRHLGPDDAEDLAQEAFLRPWERWDRIDTIDDPTAYLFRVTLNAFRMRRRRGRSRSDDSLSFPNHAIRLCRQRSHDDVDHVLRTQGPG